MSKASVLQELQSTFTIPQFLVIEGTYDIQKIIEEFKNTTLFAVRSSSAQEDGSEHSFAGLFETFLNVPKEELSNAIEYVQNSHKSDRIVSYCQKHSIDLPSSPSVIIQAMLAPSTAGVAFSSEPLSADKEVTVIAAVEGLGDKLVDGQVTGDIYYIKNSTFLYEELENEDVVLNENQRLEVATLAKKCEQHFKHPQDIEWAFEDDKLYLLQSRPITTIKHTLEGAQRLWDNSNIVESYSGVTTPLTYSFARYVYEEVYIEFCKVLSVPQERVLQNRTSFKTLLGLLDGNIYYNMMSWYRILALLPGFKFNREFMEQMMGVKEGLPSNIVKELEENASVSKTADLLGLVKTLFSLINQQRKIETTITHFYARLKSALIPNSELKNKNVDELVAHYRNLEAQLLNRWDAPLINDFLAMIYFGVLGKLCKKWLHADEYLQNDLLIDSGEIISAEPAKLIMLMADKVRAMGENSINFLATQDEKAIQEWLPRQGKLQDDITAYLKKFGDRTLEELKLESFTLDDDATSLYRAVAHMASRPRIEKKESDAKRLAEQRVENELKDNKLKLKIMNFVISQARKRVNARENLRFERTKLFGHIRRIFLEIGERFTEQNILNDSRDIFYLEVNEIIGYIEGSSTTRNLQSLTDLRKKEFNNYDADALSNRLHTYGAVNFNNTFKSFKVPHKSSDTLSGFGCCAGIVRAPVRVIEKPEGAEIFEGEILVARQTDPGWIMLFPAAAGILVERGSMLSHSAIVAREMNIPAIVGIDNLIDTLSTGDIVEFNGATGEIKIV